MSVKNNQNVDYLLSQHHLPMAAGKYELKPWFYETFSGSVQLKDFRLVRCLGSGGFSLVYLAQDKIKGNFHALKLIDKAFILES